MLWDNKVPGSSVGTRVAAAPGLVVAGLAAGFLEESQVNSSLPCQTRFEQHWERPGCLRSQVGNKEKGAHTQGRCVPTETTDTGWKSWALTDPDPESLPYGWRVGLGNRIQALVWSRRLE